MKSETVRLILEHKLIAIMRGLGKRQALSAAEELYRAGVRLVEVAYNDSLPVSDTAEIISALSARFENKLCVGAGTVTDERKLELAAEAGARYILSPDVNARVIQKTVQRGLVSIPGALTPTEICTADAAGADFVKVFPVSALSAGYMKDVRAPLCGVRLIAVGGVHAENMHTYFEQGAAAVGVGSNIVNPALAEQPGKIYELARVCVEKLPAYA